MTDFDAIWRTQDEIRTVVNAVLGECIWNLSYDERRRAIVLELTLSLDEDTVSDLCCQFPITADYDGCGPKGTRFTTYAVSSPLLPITTGVDRKGQDSLFTWILNNKQDSMQVLFIYLLLFFIKSRTFFLLRKKASSACHTFAPES